MPDEVKVRALARAAQIILRAIQKRAPSERSASTFSIEREGENYVIVSRDWAAIMTELNKRHPWWGDPERWSNENDRKPSRTHYMEKAADAASRAAGEAFGEDWAQIFCDNNPEWERE